MAAPVIRAADSGSRELSEEKRPGVILQTERLLLREMEQTDLKEDRKSVV